MPILTEAAPPRKRRLPVWGLALAVVVLLLVGLFGWSWWSPVYFELGGHALGFGYDEPALAGYYLRPGQDLSQLDSSRIPGKVTGFSFGEAEYYVFWWY